jgi:hypothetical protein
VVDFLSPYARSIDWDCAELLRCPVCGCEYNHLFRIVTNRGGTVDVIGGWDDPPRRFTTFPTHRGSSVWISFACEDGHTWSFRLQFHKGSTFSCTELGEPWCTEDEWPATFWRD